MARKRALFILAASAAVLVALRAAFPGHGLAVRVFDVGQGDAILLQCGRHQVLVDGGPDAAVLAKLGRAMPLLDREIDAVVLTHPHLDHYGGLVAVLGRYRVGRLFVSGAAADAKGYGSFEAAAEAARLEPTPLVAGDVIAVGACGAADVLWPEPGAAAAEHPHDAMVVLRVHAPAPSPSAAVLLMGDAEERVERALIARGAPLRADVLKIGHHGSRTSSSPAFLDAVAPSAAVVSCGARNFYGHPHAAPLLRLAARRASVFRTDRQGDVVIDVSAERAKVSGY